MISRLKLLAAGASALAVMSGCAQVGLGGQASCRTVYVYVPGANGSPGGVAPISQCPDVPRESLDAAGALALGPETISPAAAATRPRGDAAVYADPNAMIMAADMAAFMERTRADYVAERNSGAWGYVVADALAAGQIVLAQDVVDMMEDEDAPRFMSARHVKPWVLAFAGRMEAADREMAKLNGAVNPPTLVGHLALLSEGMGDVGAAIERYASVTGTFHPPAEEAMGTPAYLSQLLAFNGQRMLALREAELLRALERDDEAIELLERLSAVAKQDGFVDARLEDAREGKDRPKVRTLKQAMARALADEAAAVEERQALLGMMVARSADTPFNYLTSSLRQVALVLDPDNVEIRLTEAGVLYREGQFAAALRLAQLGEVDAEGRAALSSTAALAALELGAPEATRALVDQSLRVHNDSNAKLSAAGVLVSAGETQRALDLIEQALKSDLSDNEKIAALVTQAQAHFQNGAINDAVSSARKAYAVDESRGAREFLASMLVASEDRPEGLELMRTLMADEPGDTGMMNNFGYALINDPASDEELDEGFQWLKEASRLTPDEPNLLDSIGWAYYQFGDFAESRRYLELAVEAYEPFHNWEIHDHMGDIRWRLGEEDGARESWRSALGAFPPVHERAIIEQKLASGMLTPAPERRDTPDVPLQRRKQNETSDI